MISSKDLFPELEEYKEQAKPTSWNGTALHSNQKESPAIGGHQIGVKMSLFPEEKSLLASTSSSSIQEEEPGVTTGGKRCQNPKFKTVLERLLSNPVFTFFSCPADYSLGRGTMGYFQGAIEKRAPKAICHTMRRFPQNARVQKLGLGALHDLAIDSWPMKDKIIQAGGIDIILKAMRLHQKDIQVQEVACKCLYHLIAGYASALMVDRGVVVALLATIEHNLEEEDILPTACDCLLALTENSNEALETMRHKLGGVVLAKMEEKYRGKNGNIRQKAGELLRRLYAAPSSQ